MDFGLRLRPFLPVELRQRERDDELVRRGGVALPGDGFDALSLRR